MAEIKTTPEYDRWFKKLDRVVKARVVIRVDRLSLGNPGQVGDVGEGVSELKMGFGPGWRVYYVKDGKAIYLLLCGGDKSSQAADIKKAKTIAAAIKAAKGKSDG